jgi:hypothetical protein
MSELTPAQEWELARQAMVLPIDQVTPAMVEAYEAVTARQRSLIPDDHADCQWCAPDADVCGACGEPYCSSPCATLKESE